MNALVQTYRLGTSGETDQEIEDVLSSDDYGVVSDQTARTLASWYMSPGRYAENLTALAHGREFSTLYLRDELERAGMYPDHYAAMTDWLDALEALLGGDD